LEGTSGGTESNDPHGWCGEARARTRQEGEAKSKRREWMLFSTWTAGSSSPHDMTPPTETPATAEATPATPETTTPTADPKVAQLKALFPDQSDDILAAVLEAHGGSLEESTETLIAMNSDEPLEAAGNPDEVSC
jgi:hypothetical protein